MNDESTPADVRRVAHCVPVTAGMLEAAAEVRGLMDHAIDLWLHPWKRPHRNPLPVFVLFPRLARFEGWVSRRWAGGVDEDG